MPNEIDNRGYVHTTTLLLYMVQCSIIKNSKLFNNNPYTIYRIKQYILNLLFYVKEKNNISTNSTIVGSINSITLKNDTLETETPT